MAPAQSLATFLLIYFTSTVYSQEESYRLPSAIVPVNYNVHLNVPPEVFTSDYDEYSGYLTITFRTLEATNIIRLHASSSYVNVTHISVASTNLTSDQWSVNTSTNILTITLPDNMTATTETDQLYIEFESRLSTTDMYGFYKSSYVDAQNVTRYLATTQFQATYARRAFPCFDEPSFKATFDIYITYPGELKVLSNTPEESIDTEPWGDANGTLSTVKFQATPIMSTYLVAFIISNFTCTSGEFIETNVTANGSEPIIPYGVCSREEVSDSRDWAVEIGPQLVRTLNEWTGISYSEQGIGKMDQVAIPDFAAGAMENWGLITYRETALLWDPLHSANSAKDSMTQTISHEIAHMWFGNLVTLNWWSETFLNEGFARYMQYFITHQVLPDWELDKRFVTNLLQAVLVTDSVISAKALQSDANSDAEVSAKFDLISYSKGGSVLRMVEHIMGSENFRTGVQEYLNTYRFSSTEPEQLWDTLNNHVNDTISNLPANLTAVMETWVKTNGFPLIQVRRVGVSIILTQERFLISGSDNSSRWYVPISYTLSTESDEQFNNTAPREWLTPVGFVEISNLPTGLTWIIVNNLETGFYRVNYDDALWTALSNALLNSSTFSDIPEINRAQITDDAFNLARVGEIKYSKVFEIIRFLINEVAYTPWVSALNGWSFLLTRIGYDSELGKAVSTHILQLLDTVYNSVDIRNLNDTEHAYTLKQSLVLSWACRLGHESCINIVLERLGEYRITRLRPHRNIRSLIYCHGLRYTVEPDDWDMLWEAYQETDIATERSTLLSALGCTQNETQLENFLLKSLDSDSSIRSQDASSVFSAVYSNSEVGINVAFRFLRENYQAIEDRYNSLNALSNIISGIAERFTTQEQIQLLRNFIDTANISDIFRQNAENALETAQANLDWLNENIADLEEYYANTPTTTLSTTTITTVTTPTTTTTATPSTSTATTVTTPSTPTTIFSTPSTPTTQITTTTGSGNQDGGAAMVVTSVVLTIFMSVLAKLIT